MRRESVDSAEGGTFAGSFQMEPWVATTGSEWIAERPPPEEGHKEIFSATERCSKFTASLNIREEERQEMHKTAEKRRIIEAL